MTQGHSCKHSLHAVIYQLNFLRRKLLSLSALAILLVITIFYFRKQTTTSNLTEVLPAELTQRQEIVSKQDNPVTTRGPTEHRRAMNRRGSTTAPPGNERETKYFTKVRDAEHYIYSAIAHLDSNIQRANVTSYNLNIVITSLDASTEVYKCCALFKDIKTPLVTPAKVQFNNGNAKNTYIARQYICTVPINSSNLPLTVTLATSSSCSTDPKDYVTIHYPPRHPGGIALCGKISHSRALDPENVIEWFEIQRILGVDKVLIYDLDTSENVSRVFRYYQQLGILDLQPYELPGKPKNRSLSEAFKHTSQFNQDESMAVLECRQRMGGYDYVISHDLDEMIIPRDNVDLKTFLQDHVTKYPLAAAFFFYTEFFLTTWPPTNPEEDLMVKRYRQTRVARWECYKYVYLTSRVLASITHVVYPVSKEFNSQQLKPDVAILHHYRQCPEDTWKTCNVESNVDDIMTRYTELDERVLKVRTATSTQPRWTPVKWDKTTNSVAVEHER
ncbi:unnamed protein product [Lymnaea stagnalis]|uniref:Glycosyltransferase family 92 protein n=1 Tax=Lymnaea stagnalis TaxID=6523 RepID=A0AAV2H8W8_LYMST